MNYALHVGMHSYSSGLERLCKLTIACNRYAVTGEFPKNLGKYLHKTGKLLDAVEALTPVGSGSSIRSKYLTRPIDRLDPELTSMVERFASGAGRYEHLDSLANYDVKVNSYKEWSALAARASVPPGVLKLISLKERMAYAIQSELVDNGLLWSAQRVIQDLEHPLYKPSVGVVLSLFRKVRWVGAVLDNATSYTRPELPILSEVFSRIFIHSSGDFFNYHIARIGDEETIGDELQAAYERFRVREAEPGNQEVPSEE
uniref:hypothetical protein n=1 Tax=Pseudarthrobacter oxydans TaxID=1671 RepID=UPI003F49ABD3